jgi:CRISPR-associated protein Csh1
LDDSVYLIIQNMLKEIIQFTQSVLEDETFSNLRMVPIEGLHIILKIERKEGKISIAEDVEYAYFTKKTKEISSLHLKCAQWWKYSTMLGTIDTYKVFDLPAKAIHTISPFCIGFKKTNLEDGPQFSENQKKGKSQVYERINGYFSKAKEWLESNEDESICDIFKLALSDKNRLDLWLNNSGKLDEIKDNEYIVFYLDLPVEKYKSVNDRYLKEKLFNTFKKDESPDDENPDLLYGTSNWLNSFSTKKPFLKHQTGTFDVAGKISSLDAQVLQEFSSLSRRKLLPNPLPIFIVEDELKKKAIKIYKEVSNSGDDEPKGYLEIIEEIIKDFRDDIGNYYLLFMSYKGEIKDFDFVSHFQYFLNTDQSPWEIEDLFGTGAMKLVTVKDLLNQVLPKLFDNTLVVREKIKGFKYLWFDDINPAHSKPNAYLLAMKYRKAFYDYIYKSKRKSVRDTCIVDILMSGIKDNIRCDEYKNKQHTEGFNIRMKINLLFNLHQHFSIKPNQLFMPSTIVELQDHIEKVARSEAHLETNEQFAFAAGQIIARIFWESETGDASFRYLEPFLAQSKPDRFKTSISNLFKRYKHGIYSERFRNVSSEVMTFDLKEDLRKLHPHILAGVFSKNQLFGKEKQENKLTESN